MRQQSHLDFLLCQQHFARLRVFLVLHDIENSSLRHSQLDPLKKLIKRQNQPQNLDDFNQFFFQSQAKSLQKLIIYNQFNQS